MRVIIPVKRFCFAKERLAAVRTQAEREELARVMTERVLRELALSRAHEGVSVVSVERSIIGLAHELGFDWLEDPGGGLNAALAHVLESVCQTGCDDVAIVHADLPFFSAREFDRVAALHQQGPQRGLTIVADRFGDGTTVRLCRPALAVPPLYGPDSACRHAAYARAHGMEVKFVRSATLSIDCDTPADLEFIMLSASERDAAATRFGGFAS